MERKDSPRVMGLFLSLLVRLFKTQLRFRLLAQEILFQFCKFLVRLSVYVVCLLVTKIPINSIRIARRTKATCKL